MTNVPVFLLQALIVALCGVIAVVGGSYLVERIFARIDKSPEPERANVVAAGEQLRGGAWIGALERLAVYACLIAGFPMGIAMVLALKGLARYPELRAESAGLAERFIIGTFVSILFASALAGLALWLVWLVWW